MFENLSERLSHTFKSIRGQARLSDDNIQQALREVRMALIEADVALPVVKIFIQDIREKVLGQEVSKSLKPDQEFIKIVNEELVHVLGDAHCELNLKAEPPVVILLAGLQGSGKTTSAGKLAKYLQDQHNKKVMLASADVYRPAAIQQLALLAQQLNAEFMPVEKDEKPADIAKNAIEAAKKSYMDVLIFDTAGRMHVDETMMSEIKALHKQLNPAETLFVVDSMTGQDAANTAAAFHEALPLTGVILSKTDGDARGGAALSVKHITGCPIKFMGSGEKIDALEPFHPERVASRILGMGDLLSLIEEVERKSDREAGEKLAKKIKKGKTFDLNDFLAQIKQMNAMGGMAGMLGKLPGMGAAKQQAMGQAGEQAMKQTIAIICSMTERERRLPKIIAGSRKRRIANGSGNKIQDVNRLLKQFTQMQKMMKKMSKPGAMKQMMRGMPSGMGDLASLQNMLPKNKK